MSMIVRRILLASMNALVILSLAAWAQQSSAPPAADPAPAATQTQGDQHVDREQARQQQFRRLAMLAQRLSLTDDQKREWVQIQKQTTQNVWAARRDNSLNEEQMQRKIKEIHAEQKRQFLALLTPQQQEALKQWWEEQKQKQQEKNAEAAGSAASQDKPDANDDFFAGMVQDDDPPPQPAPAPTPKSQAPPH